MKNNRDFVRMCRFKYEVISGSQLYVGVPFNTIKYSLDGIYQIVRTSTPNKTPVIVPAYITISPYTVAMIGGNITNVDDTEVGKLIDGDTIVGVKLVDFYEFEEEFKENKYQIDCPQLIKAYNALTRIDRGNDANSIIDIIDEIETLLTVLKYYVVSIDTYQKYAIIKG